MVGAHSPQVVERKTWMRLLISKAEWRARATLNDRDPNFDPNPMGAMDDEDAAEEERL